MVCCNHRTKNEEENKSAKNTNLLLLLGLLTLDSASLLLALALLQEGLGDHHLVGGGDSAVGGQFPSMAIRQGRNFAECKNCSYSATFSY